MNKPHPKWLARDKLCIEIIESGTGKVEKKLGPYTSERLRDRADDGVNRQLNHERYHTRFAR